MKAYDGGAYNTDYDYLKYPDLADAPQEYFYDPNGNQTANLDKDIVATRYNNLNLPDTVQLGNGNRIIHYYLSGGERIQVVSRTYTTVLSAPKDVVTTSNEPHKETAETHLGSLIYKDGEPDRLLCKEGYWKIHKTPSSGKLNFRPFAYFCDYLGRVRLGVQSCNGKCNAEFGIFPFGADFQ